MRLRALLRTQPRRALLQSAQALPRYRHTLRQTRQKFSCRCAASCDYNLAQLKTGPNAPQRIVSLFDHLVGGSKQRRRDSEAECPSSLEVHGWLEPRRLLDRKVSRLCSLEDAIDKIRLAADGRHEVRAIGH